MRAMDCTVITAQPALDELAALLQHAEAIALDTEFLRERTYRAQLCLLQIATSDIAVCVDPLADLDLSVLTPALGAKGPPKIMHAARQDLEVLLQPIGLVQSIFDTQVAAALAGFPSQVGYAELVKRCLGGDLSKAQTRTDWSRRPLSAEQIEYALDDVRYLLPLRELLTNKLSELGRVEWLSEELEPYADASALQVDPEKAWSRIKGLRGLDPARERLAQALAAWRERRASDRDRPRGWILDDNALRELILRAPRTEDEMRGLQSLPESVIKHCGEELLRTVQSVALPEVLPMPVNVRPDPAVQSAVRRLSDVNQQIAKALGIGAELLATRRDLEELAAGRRDGAVLTGWRRSQIGEHLLAAL
jgi:ribonuclease D